MEDPSPISSGIEEKLFPKALNLYQTNEYLLESHKFSDVTFCVLPTKEDEAITRFPAHRIHTSARSRVFENMFFGVEKTTSPTETEGDLEVEIGDGVSAEAFHLLLAYIYTDSTRGITENNVMSVLYCAKKFELEGLRQECLKKAKEMVKKESKKCVLTFLKDSQVLEEDELTEVCLHLISYNAKDLLINNHDEFCYLTQNAVIAICKLDILNIPEYDLFLLVSDWAVAEADREQLDVNNISSIRFILLNILPHIRFPCMAHEKLAIEVRNSGLLTAEELTDLFAYCLSGGKTEIKYPFKARLAPQIPVTPQSSSSPGYPSSSSSSPPLSSPASSISKDNIPPHYRLTALPSQQQKNRSTSRKNSSEGMISSSSDPHKQHSNSKGSADSGSGSGGENPGGNISAAVRRSRAVLAAGNNKSRTRSD